MKARTVILPMALGLVALAARDIRWNSTELAGVVGTRDQWMILADGDGYREIEMRGETVRRVRRWQANRGESMEFVISKELESGTRVTAGQEMAYLVFPLEKYRYGSAVAELHAAHTRLNEMDADPQPKEIEIAGAKLTMAELEAERLALAEARASSLLTRDLVSHETYETHRSEHLVAQQQARILGAELDLLLKGVTEEERAVALADIEMHEAQTAEAAALAETTVIRSVLDGTVIEGPEQCLVAVAKLDTVNVYIPVDQETAMDLVVGTHVSLVGPGSLRASGRVVGLGQSANVVGDRVAVAATVLVPNNGAHLRPGMTVVATLEDE